MAYYPYNSVFEESRKAEEQRMRTAERINRDFAQYAVNGGTLDLHIDRYGDVRLRVVINPQNGALSHARVIDGQISSESFARDILALKP